LQTRRVSEGVTESSLTRRVSGGRGCGVNRCRGAIMKLQAQARRGFTLVELMVAAAVSIVIMTILATVFQMALDTMRSVRSQAEMADQLRAVGGVIQRDLGRDGGNFFSPDE